MTLLLPASAFIVCGLVILVAGVQLSRYGDVIAEKTGLGGTWMGLLVMAAVTSLPELITGGSAIVVFDVPDIAAGDAIGSCMFNLLILALLDVRDRTPLTARIHQGHVLSAGFGIALLATATVAVAAGSRMPAIGWISPFTLVLVGGYVLALRTVLVFERARSANAALEAPVEERYAALTLRQAVGRYAAFALVLVAAAALLPGAAEGLATATGLGQSFVGSLFVAASTSLPEVVVSAAAARMGALDMAVGNLFGSNMFNMFVLGIDDLLYTGGSVFAVISSAHVVSLAAAMAMTAAAIIGLTYRAARKRMYLAWDAAAIVAAYVAGVVILKLLE